MRNKNRIIIRRYKSNHPNNLQAGNWKIAYADFVTAMMAFFLLMWLIQVSSEETKKGLSEYFSNSVINLSNQSGGKGLMDKHNSIQALQHLNDEKDQNVSTKLTDTEHQKQNEVEIKDAELKKRLLELEKEKKVLIEVQKHIREKIEKLPEFKDLQSNLRMNFTDTGMRVQIIDNNKRSMFAIGSSVLLPHTQKLLKILAQSVVDLPQRIVIVGHTDALPYKNEHNYSNWDLSIDRAQATRKFLEISGIQGSHFAEVIGKEATEPFIKDDLNAPENRRIDIILLYSNH